MTKKRVTPHQMLNLALKLGEKSGWESVQLTQLASLLEIDLIDVHLHYQCKNDLVDAWFAKADHAMLKVTKLKHFSELTPELKIETLIMAWLHTVEKYKMVTQEMMLGKVEVSQLYLKTPAISQVRRTAKWIRQIVVGESMLIERALEEVALTGVFIAVFITWMQDDSEGKATTRDYIQQQLQKGAAIQSVANDYLIQPLINLKNQMKS